MKSVDIVIATPSMLLRHDPVDYPNIKTVAVAGEACSQGLLLTEVLWDILDARFSAMADNWAESVQFYNGCGPTEVRVPDSHVLWYTSGI